MHSFHESWLTAYLDNELSEEDRQLVELKLQEDESLKIMLQDLREVRALLLQLNNPPLDRDLTASVLSQIDVNRSLNDQLAENRSTNPLNSPLKQIEVHETRRWIWATCGIAASLVGALLYLQPWQPSRFDTMARVTDGEKSEVANNRMESSGAKSVASPELPPDVTGQSFGKDPTSASKSDLDGLLREESNAMKARTDSPTSIPKAMTNKENKEEGQSIATNFQEPFERKKSADSLPKVETAAPSQPRGNKMAGPLGAPGSPNGIRSKSGDPKGGSQMVEANDAIRSGGFGGGQAGGGLGGLPPAMPSQAAPIVTANNAPTDPLQIGMVQNAPPQSETSYWFAPANEVASNSNSTTEINSIQRFRVDRSISPQELTNWGYEEQILSIDSNSSPALNAQSNANLNQSDLAGQRSRSVQRQFSYGANSLRNGFQSNGFPSSNSAFNNSQSNGLAQNQTSNVDQKQGMDRGAVVKENNFGLQQAKQMGAENGTSGMSNNGLLGQGQFGANQNGVGNGLGRAGSNTTTLNLLVPEDRFETLKEQIVSTGRAFTPDMNGANSYNGQQFLQAAADLQLSNATRPPSVDNPPQLNEERWVLIEIENP